MNLVASLDKLKSARIVAVIRAPNREVLTPLTEALIAGGVTGIEVTMTTPDAIKGIADLHKRFGEQILLGVGTVMSPQTCQEARDAGAEFIVSPILDFDIISATKELNLLSLPGAFSPTEVHRAWSAGADVVKIFPATSLGPNYLKDLRGPMPDLRLMPTGGVELDNLASWFKAGAFAVGAGSSLVPGEWLKAHDWTSITLRAQEFMDLATANL